MIGPFFAFAEQALKIWGKFIDKKYTTQWDKLLAEYRVALNAEEVNQALIDNLKHELEKTMVLMTNDMKRIEAEAA